MADPPLPAEPLDPDPPAPAAVAHPAPEDPPMDIHKPKPVHNLREFLSEIAVIIIGVLIALGLEQAVEAWHWQAEVTQAREHLRDEIAFNERVYAHRVDVAPCVLARLTALKRTVAALRSGQHVGPVAEFVSPSNGPIQHEIWNSLGAAQVLVHVPKAELQRYGLFYQYREDAEYSMDRESRAWRQLHALEGDPNQLTRPELNALWVVLGDAAEMSDVLAYISRRQVEIGRALGVAIAYDHSSNVECGPIVAVPSAS